MRKQVIRVPQIAAAWDQGWLDLNKAASVEVLSEDENYRLNLRLRETRSAAGARLSPEVRRYDSFSTARKGSDLFSWPLRIAKSSARRSSF
jgi:hypothetical protein